MASWSDAREWRGCPALQSSEAGSAEFFYGSATLVCVSLGKVLERESAAATNSLVEI